jgi:uncharacterized membrane protein YagU involved in acid resistance
MNSTRAVAAGLIGTATMTALLLIEPSVGLPNIAIGQILSTALGLASAHLSSGAAIGWCIHFGVGVVFALVYAAVFARRLPGGPFVRGVLFGGLIFLLAQLIFMPLVGGGVFSRGDAEMIAGSLLGHLVYGGVVGWIYSLQPAGSSVSAS